jgi:hypothetical protein
MAAVFAVLGLFFPATANTVGARVFWELEMSSDGGTFSMKDYEERGTFYLGRNYDMSKKELGDPLLYDSKDLVTHGVCVGMTGSGKTGLCIGLLEEAAIDGIPSIVIDPKGDLADLLLTFPDLRGEDFRPWVNEDEASKQNLGPDEFAQKQADMWKAGLAEWGQEPDRIRKLKEAVDCVIYTPGSNAGLPVSILKSFSAPPRVIRDDPEALRDRINTAATSLLGLVGVSADPVKDREHILLSSLFNTAWSAGQDLDLPTLIQQIMTPPFDKVGVLDLESFYSSKHRSDLAMLINNLLAAPTFQAWLEGDALDVESMLHTRKGTPRVSIFSIAHLSDNERMFFVSLLLNEILGWVRAQSGSGSLRAIIYMDEIFGFFPPVAEPPSKKPLLTLLKQARAFGVGVLLATQNPVDLDYKGLANAGTWFIGRLQTERDKERLLEGLEGVAAGTAGKFDRGKMEEILAGLGKRVFLLYNVHEDAPVTFQTRWTLSYLAGPLTRIQIKTLMDPRRPEVAPSKPAAPFAVAPAAAATPDTPPMGTMPTTPLAQGPLPSAVAAEAAASAGGPAVVPAEVPQYYLPLRGESVKGAELVYQAGVLAAATVSFMSEKSGVSLSSRVRRVAQAPEGALAIDWESATNLETTLEDLDRKPASGAAFAPLLAAMEKAASYRTWGGGFSEWAFRTQNMEVLNSPAYRLTSNPGESEQDFRNRLQEVAAAKQQEAIGQLQRRYSAQKATYEERVAKAEQIKDKEAEQSRGRKMQTAISLGATVLGAIFGRRTFGTSTLGRATTTMRDVGRSIDESGDVKRADQAVEAAKQKLAELDAQQQAEIDALKAKMDPDSEPLERVLVRPRKGDIAVDALGLVWMPHWRDASGSMTGAWQ